MQNPEPKNLFKVFLKLHKCLAGGNLGFQAEPETSRKKLSDINHLARRRPLLGTLKSSRVRPRSSASFSHVGRRPRPAQVLPLPSW